MLEIAQSLGAGFAAALSPLYLYYALLGTVLGTITGVLPGLGPLGAMAILLGFTLTMDPTGAMILFAGIYYGAMYGGSTTSILLNIPGEAASVVTCIDGYEMTRKGRGGAALTIAAVGSFIAGTLSILGLIVVALFLSDIALRFGPPEFLAISVSGLVLLMRLSGGPVLRSVIMILTGMALATVGVDFLTGLERFTYGIAELGQGLDFLPVAMGIFGLAEVLTTAQERQAPPPVGRVSLRALLPSRTEWRRAWPAMFRGSILGFLIGLMPGPSPVIATFTAYIAEKKLSRRPEEFGRGAVEAVAGPEAANNAAVGGAYVPLFALGIPFTPAMAVVLGALMLHGLTPGPNLIQAQADLFWAVIASMYIGNVMLLLLNVPLVNLFVSILRVPRHLLLPAIVLVCLVGVYSVNASPLDLLLLAIFGLVGYGLREAGFPPAPLILAMVIGPMIETSLRQSLSITGGDPAGIVLRPICLAMYAIAALALVAPPALRWIAGARPAARGLPDGR